MNATGINIMPKVDPESVKALADGICSILSSANYNNTDRETTIVALQVFGEQVDGGSPMTHISNSTFSVGGSDRDVGKPEPGEDVLGDGQEYGFATNEA